MTRPILFQGLGVDRLERDVVARSADMIYADPPYFTQAEWTGTAGSFSDRWVWDEAAERRLTKLRHRRPVSAEMIQVLAASIEMQAYLLAMEELIHAAHRSLKATGSLWIQCDDHACAHLRMLCDVIFGPSRACGLIIWHRSAAANHNAKQYARVHDTIVVYARTGAALERLRPTQDLRGGQHEIDGVKGIYLSGILDMRLTSTSAERVGYPTQKPLGLLRTLIEAATRPGDLVVDPCCGSGTTLVAAQQLGRRAIGIDMSADAIAVASKRLDQQSAAGHQMDLFGDAA